MFLLFYLGCHNPPCGTGALDGGEERRENFKKVLDVFFDANGNIRSPHTPTEMPVLSLATEQEVSSETPKQEISSETPKPQAQPTTILGSNGAEDEEEDWSELGVNNAMNLWCGTTISDAIDNCGRNGYRCPEGICPTNELKCFMVGDECNGDKTDADNPPTPRPVASSGDITDTFFCGVDRADASACHKRCRTGSPNECPNGMSCFGYVKGCSTEAANQPSPLEPIAPATPDVSVPKAQNYCAKAKADLKTGCFTAQTCNGDDDPPCPQGTYCWGNIVCSEEPKQTPQPSPRPSTRPTQATVVVNGVCAANYPELQKTCWTAPICSNINPCSDGKKCFENIDCSFVSPNASPQAATKNPTPPPTSSSSAVETVNKVELYCAFDESELGRTCSSARSCVSEPCPLGMVCFPFKCGQDHVEEVEEEQGGMYIESDNGDSTSSIKDNSHDLCPDFFVGWHTRNDCKEYFECSNGQIGPLYTCGDGLKFDKVHGKCNYESEVNQYCYWAPAESVDNNSNVETHAPVKTKCISGFTGWDAKPGCSQYFWCNNGREESSHDCGENLLFDMELELCNFAHTVECPYELDPPTASPTKSVQEVTFSPSSKPMSASESDGVVDFDGQWQETTMSPTSRIRNAIPPWLMDIRVTSDADPAGAVHLVSWMASLLSAFVLWVQLL